MVNETDMIYYKIISIKVKPEQGRVFILSV